MAGLVTFTARLARVVTVVRANFHFETARPQSHLGGGFPRPSWASAVRRTAVVQSKLRGSPVLKFFFRISPLLLVATRIHAGTTLPTTPCTTGTLADYILLPPEGCLVGPFSFSNFSFTLGPF